MVDPNESAEQGASETTESTFAQFEAKVAADEEKPAEAPKPAESKPDDSEETSVEGEVESGESNEAPKKPKQTYQERINELTRTRREAERRAEAFERELQQLRSSQTQAEATPPAPKVEKPADGASEKAGPPNPEDYQFGELDGKYIQDLVDYRTDLRLAEDRENRAKEAREATERQQHEARLTKVQAMRQAGSAKYDDFEEKVFIGAEKGEYALSEDLGRLLVESDVAADIAYHLATNPEEAATVFAQSSLEQARYFGRMEAHFSATQEAAPSNLPAGKPATAKTPQAPKPITPARGAGGRFQPSADSSDFLAFEKVANSQ